MIDLILTDTTYEQAGLMHSKIAGRFEIVKVLPKKADDFDGMFDYADAFGRFKIAYIDSAHKISNLSNKVQKSASVFGGEFGLSSAQYNGFLLHLSTYISQNLNLQNQSKENLNEDFFDYQNNSFAYVAESSVDYSDDSFEMKIGRIRVETPYANSDDIRMAPNTFEGAWANYSYAPKLNSQVIYLKRWAGYDSQDEEQEVSQNEFKNLVSDESLGMLGASLTYEYAQNSEFNLWYNYVDNIASIVYGEIVGIYFIDKNGFHIDYGFQATKIDELDNSQVDGEVFGLMSILHYNGFFIGGAYNIAMVDDGKYVTNGFGGGPYYTSLDEATIAAISEASIGKDAEAFRLGSGYEFENGLVVEFVYGELYNDDGRIVEKDMILGYELEDRWSLGFTYTNYISSCKNNTYKRSLAKLEYSFN